MIVFRNARDIDDATLVSSAFDCRWSRTPLAGIPTPRLSLLLLLFSLRQIYTFFHRILKAIRALSSLDSERKFVEVTQTIHHGVETDPAVVVLPLDNWLLFL